VFNKQLFIVIIGILSNFILLGCGAAFLYQTFGWELAGIVTAIATITGFMSTEVGYIEEIDE